MCSYRLGRYDFPTVSTDPQQRQGGVLDLSVDRSSELPVGAQLTLKLRALIASGRLGPGQRLPGVRELADGLGVNVNTARAVYARLEGEGWLTSRQGRGTHVADDAPSRPELVDLVSAFESQVAKLGLGRQELAAALYLGSEALQRKPLHHRPSEPAAQTSSSPGSNEGEQRHAVRREIAQLEDELQRTARLTPEPDARASASKGGRLLDIAELRSIREDLRRRVAERQRAHGHFREEIAQVRAEIEQDNRTYLTGQARRSHEATGTSTTNRQRRRYRIAWTY